MCGFGLWMKRGLSWISLSPGENDLLIYVFCLSEHLVVLPLSPLHSRHRHHERALESPSSLPIGTIHLQHAVFTLFAHASKPSRLGASADTTEVSLTSGMPFDSADICSIGSLQPTSSALLPFSCCTAVHISTVRLKFSCASKLYRNSAKHAWQEPS